MECRLCLLVELFGVSGGDGPNPDTASAGVLVSRDGSELGHARQDHFDKPPSDERP